MSNYRDYKNKILQNPEVKAEYDALQLEYDIIQAMIDEKKLVKFLNKKKRRVKK